MFGFIFTIIIICIVVNSIKRQNSRKSNYDSSKTTYSSTSQNVQPYRQNPGTYQRQQTTGVTGQTARSRGTAMQTPQAVRTAQAAQTSQKETSTMDYLNEKAKQDQREHAIEKMQEQKRVDQLHGNRPVGGRYMLGDPIPAGMKIVNCGYCGAENIVKIGYHSGCDCCFCRSHLEG